eukprot:CAMPEP_0118921870 /NCGR_PEP_ID=MMETSP1169-20130426/1010_1 /TAXON_ID=36882 /ORGANISM="Pyramimonas obovata, Strain CCMP722" /LENGTH=376 /DNA_ID=CAMNT_0006862661 /DNA_START=156 /DNA_END=1286 /DNA_ORIENTATION=-
MADAAAAAEASALFVDESYEEALAMYSKAVQLNDTNASHYLQRAATHLKLESFTDALVDANRAIELDPSNPKGYLRKGVACFSLEEYDTAKQAFEHGNKLEPTKAFATWIRKCEVEIADEEEEEEEEEGSSQAQPSSIATSSVVAPPSVTPAAPSAPAPTEAPAPAYTPVVYRHEWYQTQDKVCISVFAKQAPAAHVKCDFSPATLKVVIGPPDEMGNVFQLELNLFSDIVPEQCKFAVLTSKVEITLKKNTLLQWTSLEGSGKPVVAQPLNFSNPESQLRPAYPTSKKARAPVDWDKLEAELKAEEKDEKLEGDAALNKLFQDIYGTADEETRRAMNKSYQESGGTVLSTNWKEVGTKKVEGSPPSGMEAKKYEY